MGDISIAQDIIDGVAEAFGIVGTPRTLRVKSFGDVDPDDVGSGAPVTITDITVDCFFSSIYEKRPDGTVVKSDDIKSIISVKGLSETDIRSLCVGAQVIDGTDVYSICEVPEKTEFAGVCVLVTVRLRKA